MKLEIIEPVFVDDFIPTEKEFGKIYISSKYKTAVHLCACGCGGIVVTPLREGEWTLSVNNGAITLTPSIGNWMGQTPYHAHYLITDNKIIFV